MHQMRKTVRISVLLSVLWFCGGQKSSAQQVVGYRDVVINELLADPTPVIGLPEREFVEIYNRSAREIDVTGWKIKDATSSTGTLESAILAPGAYAIICKAADASLFAPFGKVIIASVLPSLNNDADSIVLRTAAGELVDAVYYRDTWYRNSTKKEGGYTLELINPALECSTENNWIASNAAAGGTPGAANSVLDLTPDNTPPSLLSFSTPSENTITLLFSEGVDIVTAANPNLYILKPEIAVIAVTFNSTATSVTLTLAGPLQRGESYQLDVIGISDCEGNSMPDVTLEIAIGRTPLFNELIITEIMADPAPVVQLPEEEYIELYNASGEVLDLKGVNFTSGTRFGSFTEGLLMPREYAVVVPSSAVEKFSFAPKVIGLANFPGITNSGAELILRNNAGEIVFQIVFSDSWYNSTVKKDGGWSLEMVDLGKPCAGRENWKESVNTKGGTPALPNSVAGQVEAHASLEAVAVEVASEQVVNVQFSGKLDLGEIRKTVITVSPELVIQSVDPMLPAGDKISVSFVTNMQPGQVYEMTLSGLEDCSGSTMKPSLLRFGLPVLPEVGDIIINELLYDPNTGGEDFLELLNTSNKILSLSDMMIVREDPVTGDMIAKGDLKDLRRIVLPGEYIVLSAKGESVRVQYTNPGPGAFTDVSGFPNFVTEGGAAVLYRQDYTALDKLVYDKNLHFKLLDNTKGVSLERINPAVAAEERTNWTSAALQTGGATPGYRNSSYLQPSVKGELTLSPEVFSPDSDGFDDVLGITYSLDKPGYLGTVSVYTIEGIPVRKLINNLTLAQEGFFTWDGLDDAGKKARVGIYVVVLELFDLKGNKDILRGKCVVAAKVR